MIYRHFIGIMCAVAIAGAHMPTPDPDFEGDIGNEFVDEVFDQEDDLESFLSDQEDRGSDDLSDGSSDLGFDDDFNSEEGFLIDEEPDALADEEDFLSLFISDESLDDDFVEPFANYSTYYGSIGTTYLEYMRGYLPKLGYRENYVASRVGQYDYIFAYGEDLSYTGSRFSGSNVMVITWNTYNTGTFSYGLQSSFTLYPGSYLVYSNLTDFYPSLADSSAVSLRQLLILLTTVFLTFWMIYTYQVRKFRRSFHG